LQFDSLRDIIKDKIFNNEEETGIKLDWFDFFNKKVKGIRMAELTIVSGPTGSGKTTFLSQLSLSMSKLNIPLLWGSFEIRN
jgi:twinkle protein